MWRRRLLRAKGRKNQEREAQSAGVWRISVEISLNNISRLLLINQMTLTLLTIEFKWFYLINTKLILITSDLDEEQNSSDVSSRKDSPVGRLLNILW